MLRYVTWYVPGAVLCPGRGIFGQGGIVMWDSTMKMDQISCGCSWMQVG